MDWKVLILVSLLLFTLADGKPPDRYHNYGVICGNIRCRPGHRCITITKKCSKKPCRRTYVCE